jgi:hypothetical protein
LSNKKIKNPDQQGGKKIRPPALIQIEQLEHPVFCFKYIHKDHGLTNCSDEEKRALLDKLFQLSQMTWQEIQLAPRHGTGSEKINRGSINPSIPSFITDDVQFLLALRFDGKKPMLIHRNKFIMHIIFIDNTFSVYNH